MNDVGHETESVAENEVEEQSIPVIDLSGVRAGDPKATETAALDMREALMNVGFFSIVGHGVDWADVQTIYERAAAFHSLDIEIKTEPPA